MPKIAAEVGQWNVRVKHRVMRSVAHTFPAEITHPLMNIHNVEVMLSAHHLCIFPSNLQRQLNKTLLKADKKTTSRKP